MRQRPDVQHADHPAARHHRHAHHRLNSLGPQDRVQHGGVIHPVQDDRLVLGGDPPGEPAAYRDPHALADLLLQARGRRRDQLPGREIQQEHRGRVGLQHVPGPVHQLSQQIIIVEAGQRSIGDRLEIPEPGLDRHRVYHCHLVDSHIRRSCSMSRSLVMSAPLTVLSDRATARQPKGLVPASAPATGRPSRRPAADTSEGAEDIWLTAPAALQRLLNPG